MKCIGIIEQAGYRHQPCDRDRQRAVWCEYHAQIAEEVYDLSMPTLGETFYYHNESLPLIDCGRVRGKDGLHLLYDAAADIFLTVGGYHLRRSGEVWEEVDATRLVK